MCALTKSGIKRHTCKEFLSNLHLLMVMVNGKPNNLLVVIT